MTKVKTRKKKQKNSTPAMGGKSEKNPSLKYNNTHTHTHTVNGNICDESIALLALY